MGTQMTTVANQRIETLRKVKSWLKNEDTAADLGAALGGLMSAAEFTAQCMIAVKDNQDLLDCGPAELFTAMLKCAQIGAFPGPMQLVYLIPRKGKISVQIGWRCYKWWMERNPDVLKVTPMLVHRKDEIIVDGTDVVSHPFDPFDGSRQFRHPSELGPDEEPDLRGGYARIQYRDGTVGYHFISGDEIEKRRMCSEVPDLTRRGNPGVWRKWYREQALKTVLRDTYARGAVPVDPVLQRGFGQAMQQDDIALGNDPSRVEMSAPAQQPKRTSVAALAATHGVTTQIDAEFYAPKEPVTAEAEPAHDPETGEVTDEGPAGPMTDEEKAAALEMERQEAEGLTLTG